MAAHSKKLIFVALLLTGGLKASGYHAGSGIPVGSETPVAGDLQVSRNGRTPIRIISLVPAVTEILFAIGAGPQVVGVGSYDEFPPEVKALPKVGALIDPDMERMLQLRPDLAVVYGTQTDLQTQLTRAGIRLYSYRHAGLEGVFRTFEDLGSLLGRRAEADRVARGLRAQIDAVRARVNDRPRPRTLLVFERDPAALRGVYVAGGQGFLNDILEAAGGTNVFADVARESVQPSVETLLARSPEVVLEVTALPGRTQAGVWSPLTSIPAVRNKRIHQLEGQYLVVPGPRLGLAAEAIARVLHPGAF